MKKSLLLIPVLVIFFLCSNYQKIYASENPTNSPQSIEHTVHSEHNIFENPPSPYMVIPFILLLLMISTGPLFYKHFWEHNYPKVSITLGTITVFYYLFIFNDSLSLLHTLEEYISFIALLTSLFVVSGGILIKIDKKSTPVLNVIILAIGAVISNLIGTTGASMLLIRPYIRINRDRIKPYHIIFFIFIVSNIGGGLTPIGDPPLFLGFLKGIEFFWVIKHVWLIWLLAVLMVLSIFFIFDQLNYRKAISVKQSYSGKIEIRGRKNFLFLLVIIISVFLDPAVLSWVPSLDPLPFGIREIIMFTVAFISYRIADKEALKGNEFDFEPIKEVAYLFVGIFATMIPALQLIAYETHVYGAKLTADIFYWGTGILSSILDNAPTYLNFLSAAMGKFGLSIEKFEHVKIFETHDPIYLMAISVGAVFFGAMTYIGNGPNFMVKSISESSGIKLPSFLGYVAKYSVPILLPVFTLIWLLFFYGRG